MFARNNTRRSRPAIRALLLAALAAACTETSAPELDRVVAIEIRATPDVDTLHVADSVTLSVRADTLTPLRVTWIIEPTADTIVADSLVYHPPGPGTALVRAVATFSENRGGVAARRVVTPPNGAPTGTIQPVVPNNYRRVPLGDTIAVMAAFEDPDGDSLGVRWYAGEPGSPSSLFLGSGDTLRMRVDSVGIYLISVEVQDPAGARGTARMSAEGYDPITPFAWRVYAGAFGHLTSTDDGLIVADHGGKEYHTWVLCNCPLMAFDETGQMVWSIPNDSGSGAIPIPSVNGAVYFSDDTGTLRRISGSGAVEWSLDGAALGPIVLLDSSLVVPSGSGWPPAGPTRLRRISPDGAVIWDRTPDSTLTEFRPVAVGPDSTIYVTEAADGPTGLLLRLRPDGTELWRLPIAFIVGAPVAVADDSTILLTGDSITALRPDGSVRWSRAQATAPAVVGTGDIAYTSWRAGDLFTVLAFRTTTGADVWQVSYDSAGFAPTFPAVLAADGSVILALGTRLVALDGASGTERWRHILADTPSAGLLLTDSGLLLVSTNGYLEALDLGAGPLDSPWPMEWGGNRRLGRRNVP